MSAGPAGDASEPQAAEASGSQVVPGALIVDELAANAAARAAELKSDIAKGCRLRECSVLVWPLLLFS